MYVVKVNQVHMEVFHPLGIFPTEHIYKHFYIIESIVYNSFLQLVYFLYILKNDKFLLLYHLSLIKLRRGVHK